MFLSALITAYWSPTPLLCLWQVCFWCGIARAIFFSISWAFGWSTLNYFSDGFISNSKLTFFRQDPKINFISADLVKVVVVCCVEPKLKVKSAVTRTWK